MRLVESGPGHSLALSNLNFICFVGDVTRKLFRGSKGHRPLKSIRGPGPLWTAARQVVQCSWVLLGTSSIWDRINVGHLWDRLGVCTVKTNLSYSNEGGTGKERNLLVNFKDTAMNYHTIGKLSTRQLSLMWLLA